MNRKKAGRRRRRKKRGTKSERRRMRKSPCTDFLMRLVYKYGTCTTRGTTRPQSPKGTIHDADADMLLKRGEGRESGIGERSWEEEKEEERRNVYLKRKELLNVRLALSMWLWMLGSL